AMSEFEGKSGKWAWEIQKEQQAKVEELQKQLSEYIFVSETLDEMYVKEVQKSDELQKRVQFLEQELGAWKGKSIAAMVNGMCKQCGKEPLQAIVSDKDGYALLHCFGCGANKILQNRKRQSNVLVRRTRRLETSGSF
ncbi:hypothetical protein HPJ30_11170, partial [Acinetobacter baumannii]|nr:hypothetical protein [Acinetobacter baumannii]MBD0517307.1 hypothetical protein [Acinetobacter baumannii]MBD0557293.1 hypothetical protein [Acinetobacter baumannii]MBD0660272.1 hypothetical protein [Acinetobacter baumannii]